MEKAAGKASLWYHGAVFSLTSCRGWLMDMVSWCCFGVLWNTYYHDRPEVARGSHCFLFGSVKSHICGGEARGRVPTHANMIYLRWLYVPNLWFLLPPFYSALFTSSKYRTPENLVDQSFLKASFLAFSAASEVPSGRGRLAIRRYHISLSASRVY